MFDIKGKVAIVTGASAGIGRATAKLFARAGAKVVIGARRKAELDSLVGEIADREDGVVAVAGDVSDEAFAKELVGRAEESYGRLDVAFNSAGILGERGPTTGISLDGWNEALKVNLTGAFLAPKHQIPAMLKQGKGSIILMSTYRRLHCRGSRCRSLCGEQVRVDRSDAGPRCGIRTAEHPGQCHPPRLRTPMYRVASGTAEQQAYITNMHALKRIASPDELAQAVLYLASDASSFQSGTAMLVDGGLSFHANVRRLRERQTQPGNFRASVNHYGYIPQMAEQIAAAGDNRRTCRPRGT